MSDCTFFKYGIRWQLFFSKLFLFFYTLCIRTTIPAFPVIYPCKSNCNFIFFYTKSDPFLENDRCVDTSYEFSPNWKLLLAPTSMFACVSPHQHLLIVRIYATWQNPPPGVIPALFQDWQNKILCNNLCICKPPPSVPGMERQAKYLTARKMQQDNKELLWGVFPPSFLLIGLTISNDVFWARVSTGKF